MRKSQVNEPLLHINSIFKSLSFPNFWHVKYQKADNSIETAVTSNQRVHQNMSSF